MNNELYKSFEERIRSKSQNFELKPADDSWSKIEEQLNQKRKRRFFFWLIPAGVSAGIAALFLMPLKNDNSLNEMRSFNNRKIIIKTSASIPAGTTKIYSGKPVTSSFSDNEASKTIIRTLESKKNAGGEHYIHYKGQSSNNFLPPEEMPLNTDCEIIDKTSNIAENKNSPGYLTKLKAINPALNSQRISHLLYQEFEPVQKKIHQSPWSVGFSYFVMKANRKLNYNVTQPNVSLLSDSNSYIKTDKKIFVRGFGLEIYYHINSTFYLCSGIQDYYLGEAAFYDKKIYIKSLMAAPTNDYMVYIQPGSQNEHMNIYSFAEVPVSIGVSLRTGNKTSINCEAGAGYAFLLKADAWQLIILNDSLHLNSLGQAKINNLKRNNIFCNASFDFDWRFLKNFSWKNGIVVKYELNNLYNNRQLQSQNNYGYGIQTSLIFHPR